MKVSWLLIVLLASVVVSCGSSMPSQVQLAQAVAASSHFCPPLPPPKPGQKVELIKSGDVQSLIRKLQAASPDTTLLLADGVYTLAVDQFLEINKPRLTLRSASGNREAVVIERGSINLSVNVDDFTVADLTLRNPKFHNIQVRGENGVKRTRIYNVHMVDAGQQFVKISAGDGTKGKFADDGLVACSLIEYTTYARGTDITPPSYTNGVDILAGKGWIIRDNVFRRIRSQAGPTGPAVLLWKNTLDSVVQRNLIVDCWRGIALGLSAPDKYSRGGPGVQYDHQNGLVENNVFLALHEPADAAIENSFALNSRVWHNTVYYNETITHAVDWAIEYRFPPTTAVIQNNLTNRPILKRTPYPYQESTVQGNVTNATPAWFRDLTSEDFHLVEHAPAIDKGVAVPDSREDIDGDQRPAGPAPDVGADEFVSRPNPL
jgi:hypothetical protein